MGKTFKYSQKKKKIKMIKRIQNRKTKKSTKRKRTDKKNMNPNKIAALPFILGLKKNK